MNKYEECPLQYDLYYNKGWRRGYRKDSLEFGTVMEKALCSPWASPVDGPDEELRQALSIFESLWDDVGRDSSVRFGKKFDWKKLNDVGEACIRDFFARFRKRLRDPELQAELIRPVPDREGFVGFGYADFVGTVDDVFPTFLDFKTSANQWPEEKVLRDGQAENYGWLYGLKPDEPYQVAYLVAIKTKGGYCELYTRPGNPDLGHIQRRYARHIDRVGSDFDFDPAEPDWSGNPCKMCDFRLACPAFGKTLEDADGDVVCQEREVA